jgi:gliding motility-associated-like protein
MRLIKLLLFFTLILFHHISSAQNWNKKYAALGDDYANSIVILNSNIYINVINDNNCRVVKTDLNGNVISTFVFDNMFKTSTLLVSDDNNLIVVGNDRVDKGIVVLKIDLSLTTLWTYRARFSAYNYAESAIINSNGDITICGYSSTGFNSTGDRDGVVIRLTKDGQIVWSKTVFTSGSDYFSGICEGKNGDMLLTGASQGGAGLMDITLYKINSSGNALFLKLWGGAENDGGYSVDYYNDHYYVSGNTWSAGAGMQDMVLLKIDDNMNIVYAKTYGGDKIEPGLYVTHNSSGNIILIGQTTSVLGKAQDMCVLVLDENGSIIRMKNLGGDNNESIGYGYKILAELNNTYYMVCGSKSNSADFDLLLTKTDLITNDICCNALSDIIFLSSAANLTLSTPVFSSTIANNNNAFTLQKSNANLVASNLCDVSSTISTSIFTSATKFCKNNPIDFSSISNNPSATYTWDFGDVGSGSNNFSTLNNAFHTYNTSGNYTILLIATDGCVSDSDTMTINVVESIVVQSTILNTQVLYCVGDSVFFNSSTNDPNAIAQWDFDDAASGIENIVFSKNAAHVYNAPGNYTVKFTSSNDCSNDKVVLSITITDLNNANFEVLIDTCTGNVFLNNLSAHLDFGTFSWLLNGALISNNVNASAAFNSNEIYNIELITNSGSLCADALTQEILYSPTENEPKIEIPNIFSPNNDGINDELLIKSTSKCKLKKMCIYNRWGAILKESTTNFTWDGKNGQIDFPNGTYILYLEFNNQKIIQTITLLR